MKSKYFREYFCSFSSKSYYFYILGVSHLKTVFILQRGPERGYHCVCINISTKCVTMTLLRIQFIFSSRIGLQLIPLWRLVLWINHLHLVCYSTFWVYSFKRQLLCKFDLVDDVFRQFCFCVYIYICIYIHDTSWYTSTLFYLPYFQV